MASVSGHMTARPTDSCAQENPVHTQLAAAATPPCFLTFPCIMERPQGHVTTAQSRDLASHIIYGHVGALTGYT